jgi:hypothetical protein
MLGLAHESRLWIFDVDGCLVDSMSGTSLRPLALQVLGGLHERSTEIVLWSAGGAAYAQRKAQGVGIDVLVSAFEAKSERDEDGYWGTAHVAPLGRAVTFVDDQPHEIHPARHVLGVRPYIGENPHDRGFVPVLEAVRALRD